MENHLISLGISILGSVMAAYLVVVFSNIKKNFETLTKNNANLNQKIEKTTEELKELTRRIDGKVYTNQKEAEALIIKDIEKSKTLRVYAMCGSTFSDKVNSNIAKKVLDDVNLKQSYLISGVENNENNIQKRQSELPRGASDLKTKIINSLNEFKVAKALNPSIEYRLHNKKVGFRLIILDECMYLSQQENNKYGKETEIQRLSSDTPAYINFLAYFDELWNKYA